MNRETVGDHEEVRLSLTAEECELVRWEVRQIASSPYFRNSKRYPAFLTCIVERTLQGEGAEIKLSPGTARMLGEHPQGTDLFRLNRRLLSRAT